MCTHLQSDPSAGEAVCSSLSDAFENTIGRLLRGLVPRSRLALQMSSQTLSASAQSREAGDDDDDDDDNKGTGADDSRATSNAVLGERDFAATLCVYSQDVTTSSDDSINNATAIIQSSSSSSSNSNSNSTSNNNSSSSGDGDSSALLGRDSVIDSTEEDENKVWELCRSVCASLVNGGWHRSQGKEDTSANGAAFARFSLSYRSSTNPSTNPSTGPSTGFSGGRGGVSPAVNTEPLMCSSRPLAAVRLMSEVDSVEGCDAHIRIRKPPAATTFPCAFPAGTRIAPIASNNNSSNSSSSSSSSSSGGGGGTTSVGAWLFWDGAWAPSLFSVRRGLLAELRAAAEFVGTSSR